MRVKSYIMLILLVAFGLGMFAGCKSAEDKVCPKMKELLEAAELGEHYSDEECAEELAEIKEECTNPDDVFNCFLELESLEGADACEDVCQEAE